MGELQNTLTFIVVESTKSTFMSSNSKLGQDRIEYGAFGEMVAAVATRSQMSSSPRMRSVTEECIA